MITVAENPDGQTSSIAVPILDDGNAEIDVKPKKLIWVLYFIDNILIFSTMVSNYDTLSHFMYSLCVFHFLCIPEIVKLKFRFYYFLLIIKAYILFCTIFDKLVVYIVISCTSLLLQFSIILLNF